MQPLEGIRVVDLTTAYSGPLATMQLADFGAEVIKIENPKYGDNSRTWNPFINGEGIGFLYANRNKKSIALNLKSEEAKEVLFKLIETADIVVENYRPGVTKKLGIDYDVVKEIKPDIIYGSLSGYGQTGPDQHKGAFSNFAEAQSGLMYITGWPDSLPTGTGIALGDSSASMFLVQGILYALYHREKTGEGQYIDVAMVDSCIALLQHAIVQRTALDEEPQRIGNRDLSDYPYDTFIAKDGYCQLGNATAADWSPFAEAIGHPELGHDPEYKTAEDRWKKADEIHDLVQEWASQHTRKEIEAIFAEYGQLYSPIYTISEMMEDPQVNHREMIQDFEYRGTKYKDKGIPVKMSKTPGEIKSNPPEKGQHTNEVLESLGYEKDVIEEFREKGYIF